MARPSYSLTEKIFILTTALIIDAALVVAALTAYFYSTKQLQDLVAELGVMALYSTLVVIGAGLLLSIKILRDFIRTVSRKTQLALSLILIGACLSSTVLAPRTNRIFYDEHIYQNTAHSIAETGKAYMINHGNIVDGRLQPLRTEYNKQPFGYPFSLALLYRTLGVHEVLAHILNNISFLLIILAAFGTALLLFNSQHAAGWSALFVSLTPMLIRWSNTASAEPTTSAASAWAIFTALLYARTPKVSTALLFGGVFSFALYFRPESMLLAVPVFLIFLLIRPRLFLQTNFFLACLCITVLSLPEVLHLYSVQGQNWGSSGDKFVLSLFFENIKTNGWFYLANIRYPALFTGLAAVSLLFWKNWKQNIILLSWFILFWGIFLFFYAGSYDYGVDVRYSLLSVVPLALLAGCGASKLSELRIFKQKQTVVVVILVAAIILTWSKFFILVTDYGPKAIGARNDVKYARELTRVLPENSVVISHNPNMWLLWGKNAINISFVPYSKGFVRTELFEKYPGGVYLHWNYWCCVPNPPQNKLADQIVANYQLKLVRQYSEEDHPKFNYAIYRIYPPEEKVDGVLTTEQLPISESKKREKKKTLDKDA